MDITKIVNQQNNYFNSNSTKDVALRINTLKKLKFTKYFNFSKNSTKIPNSKKITTTAIPTRLIPTTQIITIPTKIR